LSGEVEPELDGTTVKPSPGSAIVEVIGKILNTFAGHNN